MHTITILPEKGKNVIVSKRDVAVKNPDEAKSQKRRTPTNQETLDRQQKDTDGGK